MGHVGEERTSRAVLLLLKIKTPSHPAWGQQRLADELAKANGWVPLVSPNTVTRILRDAGLWVPRLPEKKGGGPDGCGN